MPFTIFHVGAGALAKAAAPRHLSWSAFALANAVIDLEPVTNFIRYGDPAHRFLHTLLGASLAGAATAILGRRVCELVLRWWNRWFSPAQARWLGTEPTIGTPAMWSGALLGAWSHIGFDGIMHYDVEPLAPWRRGNLLLDLVSLEALHLGCLAATALGLVMLAARRSNDPRRSIPREGS